MLTRRAAVLILVLLAALPSSAAAAPLDPSASALPWTSAIGDLARRSPQGAPVETRPERFAAFQLDQSVLRDRLSAAPLERTRAARTAAALVSIPAPDGTLQRFEAVESPVMEDGLARRFPSIRTYAARGINDPTATARFDLTPLGFRGSVTSEQGRWRVDPYYRGDRSVYVSYFRSDLKDPQSPLLEPPDAAKELAVDVRRADVERAPGDAVVQRTYRLALTNDFSYSQYFGSTNELVEAAKASLMNRVNQLYNDDLAIRMVLIADDFKLNFKTEAEYTAAGFTPGACSGTLLTENQTVIDRIIGDANYDIGHIVKRSGGGGIASLGSVGRTGRKARGCTGVDPPIGDGFAIDYVAHEMGHQFGGPHTFDGITANCAPPNRDTFGLGEAAVEPGSGTSIQAYAGICGADDLQPNSDPYFSQQSVDDILGYVTSNLPNEEEEGTQVTTANRSPVVVAPPDRTIPVRTPFTLPGEATDADGDSLVYIWEQNDSGGEFGIPLRDDAKTDGPLFRIFSFRAVEDRFSSPAPGQNIATTADRVRTFPDPAQIAADNTNAESGTCMAAGTGLAAVDCYSEYLPTQDYTQGQLNFRLTARDRVLTGGGLSSDDVRLTVSGVQPFAVTAPVAGSSALTGGNMVNVTWNNAQTDLPPFSVANVRISYSTDGGLTFPTEVLASTPNDGAQMVVIPDVQTIRGRFKVEAIGNYFFDVSDGDLSVAQAGGQPAATATATQQPPEQAPTTGTTGPTGPSGPTGTATASATASSTASPTRTPSAVPTAVPTPGPGAGALRPSLRRTGKRLRVTGNRKARIRVSCLVVGAPVAQSCRGTAVLFAKIDGGRQRRIARTRISVPRGTTRKVTLKLSVRAFRALNRRGKLKTTARVRANGGVARKQVQLRR
ncbi:MAG: reprolysin-like metallopeptidase [Solirubrobacteraceae bacterium]